MDSIGSASSSSIGAPLLTRASFRTSPLPVFLGGGLPFGVALDVALAGARDAERAFGHIVGDHRTGTSVSLVADGDGRHQRRVDARMHVFSDHRTVFTAAIVVGRDRAGA